MVKIKKQVKPDTQQHINESIKMKKLHQCCLLSDDQKTNIN